MSKSINKIVFITFLNNFSGSPNVLSVIAKELIKKKYKIEIITNRSEGFLSNIYGAKYSYVTYKWSNNIISVLYYFIIAQIQLFFKILFRNGDNTLFYINTVTPIGAAWACKLTSKNMIYQVHENMQSQKSLFGLYRFTYKHCNRRTLFVSHYLESLAVGTKQSKVVYNSLDCEFFKAANDFLETNVSQRETILMVASLRWFKGVYEFVELARRCPEYKFEMVLSTNEQEVLNFYKETSAPDNIVMYSVQKNLHPFYQRAKLLLSLSLPDSCIETFGLTILEAMVYGVPAIVPNAGGPVELVENGINGFSLNPRNVDLLTEKVKLLMDNEDLYQNFSNASFEKSKQFNLEKMITDIEEYVINTVPDKA